MGSEWKQALRIVWLVVSAGSALILLASLPQAAPLVDRALPVCEARAHGGRCPACGMTTAFQAIPRGEWQEARNANRAAIPFYFFLLFNQAAAGAWLVSRARRPRRGELRCKC